VHWNTGSSDHLALLSARMTIPTGVYPLLVIDSLHPLPNSIRHHRQWQRAKGNAWHSVLNERIILFSQISLYIKMIQRAVML
jgi:hypothetical protein